MRMENGIPARKTLEDKEMFDDIVKAILSVMGDDAVKIILYGSVARGDNTLESDVDIAVLTRGDYDRKGMIDKLSDVIHPLNWRYDTLITVITINEDHFNKWLFDLPFYYNIDGEGIILWTREIGRICLSIALTERRKKLIPQKSY